MRVTSPMRPPRFCAQPDCANRHKARGLCNKHYQLLMRRGRLEYKQQKNSKEKHCIKCGVLLSSDNWRPSKRKQGTYKCTPCTREWERGRESEYKWRRRKRVLEEYGGECACCGDSRADFLSIDHKDNSGAEDRRKGIAGQKLISYIIRNNFPERFQVLCFNCNLAKQFRTKGEYCPCQE